MSSRRRKLDDMNDCLNLELIEMWKEDFLGADPEFSKL